MQQKVAKLPLKYTHTYGYISIHRFLLFFRVATTPVDGKLMSIYYTNEQWKEEKVDPKKK